MQFKEKVHERDGNKCVVCGMTAVDHLARYGKTLEIDHIVPGSEDTLDGCRTLCRPCHDKRHHPRGAQKHIGAKLDPSFVERIRNAAWWIGRGQSLNGIVECGTMSEVQRLEDVNGGPFPERHADEVPGRHTGPRGPNKGQRLQTVSFRLYEQDQERLRNAAAALNVTITGIMLAGITQHLCDLETQHNGGQPFAQRQGDLAGASQRKPKNSA